MDIGKGSHKKSLALGSIFPINQSPRMGYSFEPAWFFDANKFNTDKSDAMKECPNLLNESKVFLYYSNN